jgi:hypothetical protein
VLLFAVPAAFASVAWYALSSADKQLVVLPTFAVANVGLWFFIVLWNREGELPLFDIGGVCMAATILYALFPFLGYLLSEMEYTPLSARQLYNLAPTPEQFAALAWRYVVYTASFAVVYLLARGRESAGGEGLDLPDREGIVGLVLLYLLTTLLFLGLDYFYGVNFGVAYDTGMLEAAVGAFQQMPLFARQIVQNLQAILFLFKLGILVLLVSQWRDRRWRYLLLIWLSASFLWNVLHMGARTELLLTLMSVALIYHRLVKPLKPSVVIPAGIIALAVFNLFGLMRGATTLRENLEALNTLGSMDVSIYSLSNEFQTIFGGTYDLFHLRRSGVIASVPWQVYFNELVVLVPQQLLPFPKLDVQEWYMGLSQFPSYFMYGPVAQSILGLDWIELILRGGFLAGFFAAVHRWYAGRKRDFWATLFYLFLMVWSYYTFRSSTLTIVYMIVYRFLPAFLLTHLVSALVRAFRRDSARGAA